MIYYIIRNLDEPGFDEKLLEVISASFDGANMGTNDFIGNVELFNTASAAGQPLKLIWLPSAQNPRLSFDADVQDPAQYVRVDDVYKLVSEQFNVETNGISKDVLGKIVTMVKSRYPDDGGDRVAACYAHLVYEHSVECTNVISAGAGDILQGDFFVVTNNRLKEHNERVSGAFKSISAEENVTLYQNLPTDKLFIEIPTRAAVLSVDSDRIASLIPDGKMICRPYDDKNAYSYKYRERVPKHLLPMIEGNAENNNLGIQENEMTYFNALMEWVAYNIRQEFDDVDEEALKAGTCMIDGVSQEYLVELIDHIYSWHWSHNPNIPVGFSFDDDDSESDEVEDKHSGESRYTFTYDADIKERYNALVILNDYLESTSAKLGFRVYVETVIKIARWGIRKPTAITFNDSPEMFDLATNRVKQNIGSVSEYQVKLSNGFQYSLGLFVTLGSHIADSSIGVEGVNNPIGFVVASTYVREIDGNELVVPTYFSLFDALPAIIDGSLNIDGITWDGTNFSVDGEYKTVNIEELINSYDATMDSFLQNPFSRSTELKDLCIEFGASGGDSRQNLMSMISEGIKYPDLSRKFESYKMHSASELQGMILKGVAYSPMAVLITNVTRVTLPLILEIDKECNWSSNPAAWLGKWKERLDEWEGLKSFYVSENPELNEPKQSLGVEGQQIMNAFGSEAASSTPTVTSAPTTGTPTVGTPMNVAEVSNNNMLIYEIPAGEAKPILNEDKSSIIGGYVRNNIIVNGKKLARFVVFDYNTWDSLKGDSVHDGQIDGVRIHKLFPYFIDDLTKIATGQYDQIKLVFNSIESIHHFTLFFKDWAKKLDAM